MSIIELIAVIGAVGGLVSTIAVARVVVVRRQIADEAQHMLARAQGDLITEVMTRQRAQRHGYLMGPERISDPILDPGSQPPPPDLEAERSFKAAWLEPNEDFIRETDKILNDIEWARLTDAEQRVRAARERAEHEKMHRDNPGAIYGCCIRVGVASIGPGEEKPTYSFEKHDQGQAVFP